MRPSFPTFLLLLTILVSTSGFDTTTEWSASSNDSSFPSNSPVLYIIPTTDAFDQVGFVGSNETAPTGAVTTGLTFFGTSVAYAASDSDYQMSFWAQPTNTTGVWALMWNSSGAPEDDSVPVTLKSVAPLQISRE